MVQLISAVLPHRHAPQPPEQVLMWPTARKKVPQFSENSWCRGTFQTFGNDGRLKDEVTKIKEDNAPHGYDDELRRTEYESISDLDGNNWGCEYKKIKLV